MYLSKETVAQNGKNASRQMLVAGVFVVVGFYSILMGVTGNQAFRPYLIPYSILVVIFFLPFLLGVFNRRQIQLTYRINAVLESSASDSIPIHDLARRLHCSDRKLLSDVRAILERGYLLCCALEADKEPVLRLCGAERTRAE